MNLKLLKIFSLITCLWFQSTGIISAQAQIPQMPVRVATRIVPPFVVKEDDRLSGFSIDLWNAIATQMHLHSNFTILPTVDDLLTSVHTGKADLAISAISITAERDKFFDFSQPIYGSGLQIMVPIKPSGPANSALITLKNIFTPSLLGLLAIMFLILLVPANIVWFAERRHRAGMFDTKSYFPGILKAAWWAAGTLATQADEMPKSTLGRVVAVVWMFIGVVFVAYFTATVTSALTVQQLRSDIKGPNDLSGKIIATVAGSTSEQYLRAQHLTLQKFPDVSHAYNALETGQVDAVVYDSPVLLYYAAHDGKGKVDVVGDIFRKEDYGIVFPADSPFRKPINNALLQIKENGTYDQLYTKWFGAK